MQIFFLLITHFWAIEWLGAVARWNIFQQGWIVQCCLLRLFSYSCKSNSPWSSPCIFYEYNRARNIGWVGVQWSCHLSCLWCVFMCSLMWSLNIKCCKRMLPEKQVVKEIQNYTVNDLSLLAKIKFQFLEIIHWKTKWQILLLLSDMNFSFRITRKWSWRDQSKGVLWIWLLSSSSLPKPSHSDPRTRTCSLSMADSEISTWTTWRLPLHWHWLTCGVLLVFLLVAVQDVMEICLSLVSHFFQEFVNLSLFSFQIKES